MLNRARRLAFTRGLLAVCPVLLCPGPPLFAAEGAREPGSAVAESAEPGPAWNGFRLDDAVIPKEKFAIGGVRDGVRAIDSPRFVGAEEASQWVSPSMLVLGVQLGESARAYPERILDYHQVVNDEIGERPIVVTWDPVSGVPLVFSRRLGDRSLHFGVSGLLYQSHALIYDRETESLWSPFSGVAIAGPLKGEVLKRIPFSKEPAADWYSKHPRTRFLVRPFPKVIDYRRSPFAAHWSSPEIPFPVAATDPRFHPKEVVLGVSIGGVDRAYLGSVLTEAGGRIVDVVRGQKIRIEYDTETASFRWQAPDTLEVTEAYWFAWKAHRPETEVWQGIFPDAADR